MKKTYTLKDKQLTFSLAQEGIPAGEEVSAVFVKGSFTQWKEDPHYYFTKENNSSWTLTLPLTDFSVPGNSGFPEYKFVLKTPDGLKEMECDTDESRSLYGNDVLVLNEDQEWYMETVNDLFGKIRPLCKWNLESKDDLDKLANVRLVTGTEALYRGYHPYKKSRPNLDTENVRIKRVNDFLEEHKVASIITLCGDEKPDPSLGEEISPYVAEIQKKGNQLFIDTSYEAVYFSSDGEEYARVLKEIIAFIKTHPAPFYIHCRLGSDRTGTMCAALALLCGAPWEEVSWDYERTSNAGIMEYRNERLLDYSISRAMGSEVGIGRNLPERFSQALINRGIVTREDIECLKEKLEAYF